MKKVLVILFLMGLVCFVNAATTFDFAVRNSPPYLDEQDPTKGLGYDLYTEIFKNAGYNLKFSFYPTQRIIMNVENGDNTFGFANRAGGISDKVIYVPFFNVQRIIVHKKTTDFKYTSNNDLKNVSIAAVSTGDVALMLDKLGLKFDPSIDELAVVRKLFADRIQVGILTDLTYYDLVKKYYPKQINDMKVEEKPFIIADVGIIISKKDPNCEKYAKEIQNAIAKMKKDGSYMRIFEKYYGKGKVPSYIPLK